MLTQEGVIQARYNSDAMFETRRHKKKVGEEWRKNSGANALKSYYLIL